MLQSKRPNLKDVTICAVDSVTPDLSLMAIRKSLTRCRFDRAILFTNVSVDCEPDCELIPISRLDSKFDYSRFILKELGAYVNTEYVLIIQWDGYVIDGEVWTDDFMDFDYIGAKWHWHKDGYNVGNGGFSLRSRSLLKATSMDSFLLLPNVPEDHLICRVHRNYLEENHLLRFAPEILADRFSYERSIPHRRTLGYHGLFNMWRHVEDAEMAIILDKLTPEIILSREYTELTLQYFNLRKFNILDQCIRKILPLMSFDSLANRVTKLTNSEHLGRTYGEYVKTIDLG